MRFPCFSLLVPVGAVVGSAISCLVCDDLKIDDIQRWSSLSLSLSPFSVILVVCVCVCWFPRSSNHQFLSSAAIYSFTVFLVSSSFWWYSLLTFRFTLPQSCKNVKTVVNARRSWIIYYPFTHTFVSDELRICIPLQSHCTWVFCNYNLYGCQQYLCLLVFVSTKYLGKNLSACTAKPIFSWTRIIRFWPFSSSGYWIDCRSVLKPK